MTMFRMPVFTWNMLVVSVLVLIAFPVLTAAGAMLLADRHLGAHIFDAAAGGSPILWQHLFWFFGHPEVYILVLPYFGVITEVLPVFSWRPVFGYAGIVFATLAIAALSVGVWAHHMFATGAVLLPFFSGDVDAHRRADRREVLQLDRHDVGRAHHVPDADAVRRRLPVHVPARRRDRRDAGVGADRLPRARHATSSSPTCTTCCSAASVFALFAGIYYWFPKFTGRRLHEGWGKLHFWMTFVGFHLTFFVQHVLGLRGHAPAGRRLPRERRLHSSSTRCRRSAPSCSARRRCRSCGTCGARWRRGRGRRRRPVGRRADPRVGDVVAAAAGELRRPAAADPLEPPGVGRPPRRRRGRR